MKIKALIPFAGTEASLAIGEEREVSDAFGADMVSAGYAEKVGGVTPQAEAKPKAPAKKPAPKKTASKKG